ncbi:acylphosphatase [Patescibacteria group bacterium]|nr:acylphosphatase [Patescibacteria group bacterium]MCL5009999.1 acylphosphatase [Patescibacteria group bacterium]
MQQAHIFISGFVQGVGFRRFIKKNAENLGIVGWVRNTRDNKVEALFQGSEKNIKTVIMVSGKGPFLAEIKNLEVIREDIKEDFRDFRIIT